MGLQKVSATADQERSAACARLDRKRDFIFMNHEELPTGEQSASLHNAGAVVRHQNPFSHLPTPLSDTSMSREMREKWVIPFYMRRLESNESDFTAACVEATPELTLSLLSEFNWRTRVVGARFVAVRQFFELQQDISNLFLKSEVCYVGDDYCLALASLANKAAADTLSEYLDYYLNQPDLWYDQGQAMSALLYLDELLGSNRTTQFSGAWQQFVSNKPNWNLTDFNKQFRASISTIEDIRQIIEAKA
jgi:hypothetical protein